MWTTAEKRVASSLLPWFYLILIFFSYVLCGINIYRIQPILPIIMETLHIDIAQGGILISAATFLNIFVTLPIGLLITRIGVRTAGLLSLGFLLCGAVLGSLTGAFIGIIIAQVLTSVGTAFMSVSGPVFINLLFSKKGHSTAMGLFTSAHTASQFITFVLLPQITFVGRIKSAWWIDLVFGSILFVGWVVFIRRPVVERLVEEQKRDSESCEIRKENDAYHIKAALKNPDLWQLGIGIFFAMLTVGCVLGYLPSYLVAERGMALSYASSICSLNAVSGFLSAISAGFLSDRFKTRKWIYLIAIVIMASLRILQVVVPTGPFLVLIVIMQGLPAAAPPLLMATATSVVSHPKQKSIAAAIVTTGLLGAMAISPLMFGFLVRALGYNISFFIMAPICLLGLIGMMTVKGIK